MIISIDGGAATGKTTIAKELSKKINFLHLNSGLIYRAITYILIKNNFLYMDDNFYLEYLSKINFKISGDSFNIINYNNIDITPLLHDKSIADNLNIISNNVFIRNYVTKLQRDIAKNTNVVCEGRDIGTVVFPLAQFKFFLKANIDTRVERRYQQYLKNNIRIKKEKIKTMLLNRDYNDIHRKISPLMKAVDAITLDTTNKSINDQINIIITKVKKDKYDTK